MYINWKKGTFLGVYFTLECQTNKPNYSKYEYPYTY